MFGLDFSYGYVMYPVMFGLDCSYGYVMYPVMFGLDYKYGYVMYPVMFPLKDSNISYCSLNLRTLFNIQ